MLNGDGNENGIKINRSNQQKYKLQVQHTFCFSLAFFCTTTMSQLHIIFMEELSYVFTQYFVSCVHVRFRFSLPIIFTLLAAGISHCLTAALIFMFFFLQNSSLLFSITRSSSFSVIQVSVNIKNNVKKDTSLLFFLS